MTGQSKMDDHEKEKDAADAFKAQGGFEEVQAYRRGSYGTGRAVESEIHDERYETTRRGLKSRHAQMIALGGTIGTGLFVGSGQTLARGGPAFILGSYIFMSFTILCIVTAMVEIGAYLPTPGSSMNLFGYRYVSKALGFALGWLYFYSLGILVPYEITAAGLVIDYWKSDINLGVWITVMIVVIVGLNLLPVSFYGETEFWFASTKVIMMIGLLFVSFILFWGGGPNHDRLGFRYWKHPGAANTYLESGDTGRFLALLSTLVLSAFPFTFAPELLIVTAGEMKNPRRNLPIASRRYIYRLILFYVGCVLAIGVICPSDAEELTSGGKGAGSSAFVVGIKRSGIKVLDSIINAGIIISAWSSGNSFLYLSSRSLYALALSGNAPSFFKACTRKGVPYRAVACSSLFCVLAYLNLSNSSAVVFNWFVNLTNTSGFISWICSAIIYLRFRKACETQGVTDLPYRSALQPWGSWVAIVVFTFLTIINGFDVFFFKTQHKQFNVSSFFTAYVGIPIFLAIFFAHFFFGPREASESRWARPPEAVDLHSGLAQVLAEEKPPKPIDPNNRWLGWIKRIWE